MEDSLKSFVAMMTMAGLFITAILSFIVIFPQGQGVSFQDAQSQSAYLTIQSNNSSGIDTQLTSIDNQTTTGFNDWDVTQGFMGSGTIKQTSGTGIKTYSTNVFSVISLVAGQLFDANSPILYVILVFSTFTGLYVIYLTYKFVRQGN